ncbi:MAG: ribosome maturation factor RimM [Gammaproteobacteria bacterium]|nr:ribosome maturation factor RimM [Gammaproteobacteria bacterium]
MVPVGRIIGPYGVHGWLKVYSYTQPKKNILDYAPWFIQVGQGPLEMRRVLDGRVHGKNIVAQIEGCTSREQVSRWVGAEISVERSSLPRLEPGEYYWTDLIGWKVITVTGVELGTVDHLLETGANDVVVVKGERERLIPYIMGSVIRETDPVARILRVDWDPEF